MRSLTELWGRQGAETAATRTAFVLSGGAAMGALQVGMLRALMERRIHPDVILGCSVGAINGVVLAGGPSLATVGRMQDVWMDLIDRELVPTGLLPSPVQLVRKGESISTNEGLRDLLEEIVPADTFEGLEVAFQCVATDISAGSEAWFETGRVVPAILASAAVPVVFPTVEIDGHRFLDGGIVDEVPVRRAVELGANRIYVLQVGTLDHPRPELRRPLDAALLSYWIARRSRLLDDLARVPADVEVILLPHGDPEPVRFDDLSSSALLMDIAYRASAEHLDALAEGRIEPTFGPHPVPTRRSEPPDDAEGRVATAQRLFAAARELIGRPSTETGTAVDTPGPAESSAEPSGDVARAADDGGVTESKGRLLERAEALGPAMRALINRMLERDVDVEEATKVDVDEIGAVEGSVDGSAPTTVTDGDADDTRPARDATGRQSDPDADHSPEK